ncbi:MAG: GHMP kinase, partial [Euryarchaeota archaeon]|nr:GHMP kinase [Euryarchaeota archaeon]
RISFIGGGSDLESFYSRGYGAVVSTSINKYMYIMIHPYFHDKIRVKYSKTEDVEDIDELKHPLVKECLRLTGIEKGIEIASIADVPAGTGIGSSSTFTVCLLHALYTHKRKFVSKERLAKDACRVEIDILKEPIGKQDQYAASYGGLNYIRFNRDKTVLVEPIVWDPEVKRRLERNLLMFYVGNVRKASRILKEQKENMSKEDKYEKVRKMVQLAEELRDSLNMGRIRAVGEIMHEGWLLKKELAHGISNPAFDRYYDAAMKAGAVGGKLLGAGGGGFLLFYCEPKYQNRARRSLNLRELKFRLDNEGAKIIYMSE